MTKRLHPNSWIIWQFGEKNSAAYIQKATIIRTPPREQKKNPPMMIILKLVLWMGYLKCTNEGKKYEKQVRDYFRLSDLNLFP